MKQVTKTVIIGLPDGLFYDFGQSFLANVNVFLSIHLLHRIHNFGDFSFLGKFIESYKFTNSMISHTTTKKEEKNENVNHIDKLRVNGVLFSVWVIGNRETEKLNA